MRKIMIAGVIITLFWKQEVIYALPTPVPANYKSLVIGQDVKLPFTLKEKNKPIFLHFFNPDCPCSKFNIQHFKTLVHEYGNQVIFFVVVETPNTAYSSYQIKNKFDLDIPVIMDPDKKIAGACGVYSTPQAAIIDVTNKLYYRGNYNRARYCTDNKSDYAQMALDSLVKGMARPEFTLMATRSYGCALPECKKIISIKTQ